MPIYYDSENASGNYEDDVWFDAPEDQFENSVEHQFENALENQDDKVFEEMVCRSGDYWH